MKDIEISKKTFTILPSRYLYNFKNNIFLKSFTKEILFNCNHIRSRGKKNIIEKLLNF